MLYGAEKVKKEEAKMSPEERRGKKKRKRIQGTHL